MGKRMCGIKGGEKYPPTLRLPTLIYFILGGLFFWEFFSPQQENELGVKGVNPPSLSDFLWLEGSKGMAELRGFSQTDMTMFWNRLGSIGLGSFNINSIA